MKKIFFLVVTLAAGCASQPPAPSSPEPTTTSSSERQPAPPAGAPPASEGKRESIAVASILQTARAEASSGQLASAAASIERALRIEPRNPRLWNELARIRLQQRNYAQAASTAARSNAFAGSDADLRASNADIIAQARRAQGR